MDLYSDLPSAAGSDAKVYVIAQSFPYPVMKTEPLIELTEQQPVSSSKSADLYADVQSVGGGGGATPSLPSASTWTLGASKLMAPTHLMARRTQQPKAAPPAHKRIVMNTSVTVVQEGGGSVLASDNKSGGAGGETVVGIHDALPGASSRAKTGADSLTAQQFVDEYDPARPNEYAVFLKEMRQRKADAKRQAEEERRRAAPAPWEVGAGDGGNERDDHEQRRGRDRSRERERGRERSRDRDSDARRRRSRSRSRDRGDRGAQYENDRRERDRDAEMGPPPSFGGVGGPGAASSPSVWDGSGGSLDAGGMGGGAGRGRGRPVPAWQQAQAGGAEAGGSIGSFSGPAAPAPVGRGGRGVSIEPAWKTAAANIAAKVSPQAGASDSGGGGSLSGGRGAGGAGGFSSGGFIGGGGGDRPAASGGFGGGGGGGGVEEDGGGGGSFAEKMMRKMGWKEGKGLGARNQGMSTALDTQKTGSRTGKIVSMGGGGGGFGLKGAPSRCVLLTNMVGPHEVDAMLEEETRQECSKYGSIQNCVIHVIQGADVPEDQAVRIFLLFDRQEGAMKATIDLDGRFFGGRSVKASFFPEQKFFNKDFDPEDTE